MKTLILSFLLTLSAVSAFAEESVVIPAFLEAAELYVGGAGDLRETQLLNPQTRAALEVLVNKKVDPTYLRSIAQTQNLSWALPADDEFDGWLSERVTDPVEVPEVALHAFKFDVVRTRGIFKDDVYAYYFITDGVIPTGKVTSVYKGIGRGQSAFFNELDRAIFPLMGVAAKKPTNHLIVDYGIVRSVGDEVKKLQQLSAVIIDLAIAVYASYDPQNAQVIVNLRKEIKAMADLLLSLKTDERLVTASFGFKAQELAEVFKDSTFVEFVKNHKASSQRGWEYNLHFRMLKN